MKAKPDIMKRLARDVWATGQSISATARICDLPVGTVKAWRHRGKWVRRGAAVHATPASVGKKTGDATTHRGLNWTHMPGRPGGKQATFALFRRNLWPPRQWHVPKELEGGELLMLLQERACLGQAAKKKTWRPVDGETGRTQP